jgi:hypothetical protein
MWQPIKKMLPSIVLSFARFIYSPGYRMSLRSERTLRQVQSVWSDIEVKTKGRVVSGPFRGMQYITESVGSAITPKILGTYEMELHLIIESIVAQRPRYIIDIGAAEGFYAVGLAMRLPNCKIIAFESESRGQDLLRQLADINGVSDRIEINGHCTLESLHNCLELIPSDIVIVCDVEGAELSLLDPARLPKLLHCSILVELHPVVEKKIKSVFFSRFSAASEITTIVGRVRMVKNFPEMINTPLNKFQKLACMDEVRSGCMEWLWIDPRRK